MKTITLKILKEDIMTSDYINPCDCAIRRAVDRINPNIHTNFGAKIILIDNKLIDIKDLDYKVRQMYAFKEKSNFEPMPSFPAIENHYNVKELLEPADFEHVVTINS